MSFLSALARYMTTRGADAGWDEQRLPGDLRDVRRLAPDLLTGTSGDRRAGRSAAPRAAGPLAQPNVTGQWVLRQNDPELLQVYEQSGGGAALKHWLARNTPGSGAAPAATFAQADRSAHPVALVAHRPGQAPWEGPRGEPGEGAFRGGMSALRRQDAGPAPRAVPDGGPPAAGPTQQSGSPPQPTPQAAWVSPTGLPLRGTDYGGSGHFGASRSRNGKKGVHKGADYLAKAGQDVGAPTAGLVVREARPSALHPHLSGLLLKTDAGEEVRMFYVDFDRSLIGKRVHAGQVVGKAQSLKGAYAAPDHVHTEVWRNGVAIDPSSLIGNSGRGTSPAR
jgi:murein DD-endopeptidase MepM/ murein hydrolase activator NlpD